VNKQADEWRTLSCFLERKGANVRCGEETGACLLLNRSSCCLFSFLRSRRFKQAVDLINRIDARKLPVLINRVIQRIGDEKVAYCMKYCVMSIVVAMLVACLSCIAIAIATAAQCSDAPRNSRTTSLPRRRKRRSSP